jgi:hypothetical protein
MAKINPFPGPVVDDWSFGCTDPHDEGKEHLQEISRNKK